MALKRIVEGVFLVPMGAANAFLLDDGGELTLVDAGFPGKASVVFDAVKQLGRPLDQLKHLVFTHGHPDHIGSAAAIVRETGARTYMHPADVSHAESGGPFRPMAASPGLLQKVLFRFFWDPGERVEPVRIDQHLHDGEILPVAGGLKVIHAPGHCAGQVALLWRGTRMLFAGDVCTHLATLGDPVGFENVDDGRRSQRKLAELSFEAAGFGHGRPIVSGASDKFRRRWATGARERRE